MIRCPPRFTRTDTPFPYTTLFRAVAGVVNFITKRDFEGVNHRAQGCLSSRGDRENLFVSGTYGKNFADGRGNVAISAEYAEASPLYFTDRDKLTGAYSGRCQYQLTDDTVGEPAEIGRAHV